MRLVNTVEHLASKEKVIFLRGIVGDQKWGYKESERRTDFWFKYDSNMFCNLWQGLVIETKYFQA